MKTIVRRKSRLFVIDKSQLIPAAKKDEVCSALYAAIFTEFRGANKNPKYVGKTPKELLDEVNIFANDWLKARGLL